MNPIRLKNFAVAITTLALLTANAPPAFSQDLTPDQQSELQDLYDKRDALIDKLEVNQKTCPECEINNHKRVLKVLRKLYPEFKRMNDKEIEKAALKKWPGNPTDISPLRGTQYFEFKDPGFETYVKLHPKAVRPRKKDLKFNRRTAKLHSAELNENRAEVRKIQDQIDQIEGLVVEERVLGTVKSGLNAVEEFNKGPNRSPAGTHVPAGHVQSADRGQNPKEGQQTETPSGMMKEGHGGKAGAIPNNDGPELRPAQEPINNP